MTDYPTGLSVSVVTAINTRWYAFFSPVIAYFQGLKESHSAIIVHDENGDIVYESVFPRSRVMPFEEWQKIYKLKKQFFYEVDGEKAPDLLKMLRQNVEVDYSVRQLAAIFLTMLKIPIFFIKKLITGSGKQICTEFCAIFLVWHKGHEFKEPLDLVDLNDLISACTITCTHYIER